MYLYSYFVDNKIKNKNRTKNVNISFIIFSILHFGSSF